MSSHINWLQALRTLLTDNKFEHQSKLVMLHWVNQAIEERDSLRNKLTVQLNALEDSMEECARLRRQLRQMSTEGKSNEQGA